jgi:hypothetical protein
MSVATENAINTMQINHNNNFYQQGTDNNNDWATKRKSFGDDNFSDVDVDVDDINHIDESNKGNKQAGNVSVVNHSHDHDDSNLPAIKSPTKEQTKPKKKSKSTNSPIVVESGQNTTIYFQLSPAEHNKLTAIATLLGYENANDFAKELFLNSLNPYFSVAAQSLRQQLFQQQPNEVSQVNFNQASFNQANFNQLSQASQYAQTQASQYAQANDGSELNYSNEQQQT